MLTFEEFFVKKRIDLKQFQQAQPDLYKEFKAHYPLMGEKSFDHTKKYWFNRLRKDFQLSEDEVARMAKPATPKAVEKPASADATTRKPSGFTPRFKANPAVPKPDSSEIDAPTAKSPTGFKPRFKPGVTPIAKPTKESEAVQPDSDNPPATEAAKALGFKPRFRAASTQKPTEDNSEAPETGSPTNKPDAQAKPLGFKPRFKAGVTKAAKPLGELTQKPPTDEDKDENT